MARPTGARKDKDAPRTVSQRFDYTGRWRLGERTGPTRTQPCAAGAPDAAAPPEALRLRRHRAPCRHAGSGAPGSVHRPLDAAGRLRTRRVIRLDLRPTGGAFLVDAGDDPPRYQSRLPGFAPSCATGPGARRVPKRDLRQGPPRRV